MKAARKKAAPAVLADARADQKLQTYLAVTLALSGVKLSPAQTAAFRSMDMRTRAELTPAERARSDRQDCRLFDQDRNATRAGPSSPDGRRG